MISHSLLPLLLLLFLPFSSSQSLFLRYSECLPVPFRCGNLNFTISYPFRIKARRDYCGYPDFFLDCTSVASRSSNNNNTNEILLITIGGVGFQVKSIDYFNHILTLVDHDFVYQSCPVTYTHATFSNSIFEYSDRNQNLTVYFNCSSAVSDPRLSDTNCSLETTGRHSYYSFQDAQSPALEGECAGPVMVPVNKTAAEQLSNREVGFGDAVKEGFMLKWIPGRGWCSFCIDSGGVCGYNGANPEEKTCYCPDGWVVGVCSPGKKKSTKYIVIGVCVGAALLLAACGLFFLYKRMKEKQPSSSNLLDRTFSSEPSSMKDPEYGRTLYQTPIFSYKELQEATNNFDESLELGDGGFGTVYKGKLRDGRTVAVKRLYENNYKRIEQFSNEIAILSGLRHQNLVTLYGCTSRHSRELLLVYEFVPKGTLADHLHGPHAHEGVLTWPLRMNIAIETADALAYLHAVEPQIIHRDVKTNNILLDGNFHVKVADFGLSRLFPVDATHVSTAPQGTPGYVDPEYHQCYQLTDKSDVYSFGVVLVELISSMLAVDITRDRREINLANLAINKIQNGEVDQLIDPMLGCDADFEIKRMVTLVAELAFRCLQADRDLRPPIREALEVLQGIQNSGRKAENATEMEMPARDRDDTRLLKSLPYSPDTVVDKWSSTSTTPNTSK